MENKFKNCNRNKFIEIDDIFFFVKSGWKYLFMENNVGKYVASGQKSIKVHFNTKISVITNISKFDRRVFHSDFTSFSTFSLNMVIDAWSIKFQNYSLREIKVYHGFPLKCDFSKSKK